MLFLLDEFAVLGHMRQLEDAAGQIAGYGVKLWPIMQDLGQLKALYRERWETFMGNAGVLQFFGNNDLTTLEWISQAARHDDHRAAIGHRTATPRRRERRARGKLAAAHDGRCWSPTKSPLFSAVPIRCCAS